MVLTEFSNYHLRGLGVKKAASVAGYRYSIINHQLKTKANRNFYHAVVCCVIVIFIKFG